MRIEGRNARVINVADDDEALALIEVADAADEHLDLSDFKPAKAARIREVIDTIKNDLG